MREIKRIESIKRESASEIEKMRRAERLRQSILRKAFSRKLMPQEVGDACRNEYRKNKHK